MTLVSRLGYKPNKSKSLTAPTLTSVKEITVIIPVKDNQNGLNSFLKEFIKTHSSESFPFEFIIIDNNSASEIKLEPLYKTIPHRILKCSKLGPAAARNLGAKEAKTNWLLFTDSDCVPTQTMLSGYLENQSGALGYAGNIKAIENNLLSSYYDSQEILIPPEVLNNGKITPDYLITANCLIWKSAFEEVGGFNENFKWAGGEDIDLGFKLRSIGDLEYSMRSVIKHDFEPHLKSFRSRFRRYGKGNKIVSELYNIDLSPKPFLPIKKTPANFALAFIQFLSLRKGYYT